MEQNRKPRNRTTQLCPSVGKDTKAYRLFNKWGWNN